MKYKFFLLLILFFNLSYPQGAVVKIFEKHAKYFATPTLDPFSKIWIFHLDSVFAITPDKKLLKGKGFGESSYFRDYFIDTLTSIVERGGDLLGLAKYTIVGNEIKISLDTTYRGINTLRFDPINRIVLRKSENGWLFKKFHWDENYTMHDDSIIGYIEAPHWQAGWLGFLNNWSIFRLTSWFFVEGSVIVAINVNSYNIKSFKFEIGAPAMKNFAGHWVIDPYPLSNYKDVRFIINESNSDINFLILDTLRNICWPLGSIENFNYWGITDTGNLTAEVITEDKKVLLKIYTYTKSPTAFVIDLISPPSDKFIVFNIIENIVDWQTGNSSFINRIFMITLPPLTSEPNNNLPRFNLYQNYPNPFNPTTTIEFDIPERANVKLVVYDILGREVETLIDKELEPGKYKVNFDATNLPSGVYFYTLRTPKFTKTNKMLLIK
jgi:hypothetical protein